MAGWLTAVLTPALALAAPAPRAAAPTEGPPALVGEWVVGTAVRAGTQSAGGGMALTFAADGRVLVRAGGRVAAKGAYQVDLAKDPAELDWAVLDGRVTLRGIFRLDGDALTLCLDDAPASVRPAAFGAPPGSTAVLMTLTRVREKK